MSAGTDVVIIGGGVIGCAIARLLREQGAFVTVLERGEPARGATWAAGGMLSPLIESDDDDPFFHIADRSFDLYPALVESLESETRIKLDYRRTGKLQCAVSDEDVARLEALARSSRAARYGLRLLDGDAARQEQPLLSCDVNRTLFVERDYCIDNRLLGIALSCASEARGALVRRKTEVAGVAIEGGCVAGVTLQNGERIEASHVVVAGGAWSAALQGLPRTLPVRPLRGEMLCLTTKGVNSFTPFAPSIGTEHCYMIPRSDGRVLLGATVDDVGFAPGPTPAGITWLVNEAITVMPAIATLPIVETWAGYRPGTPDAWPILGPDPDVSGLHYATGHYRNGILLAPVTAEITVASINGGLPEYAKPFSISRFESMQ